MEENVAIITYETPFAPCGGIASVIARLPGSFRSALGRPPAVITPYHHRIETTTALSLSDAGSFSVQYSPKSRPLEKRDVRVNIGRYEDQGCPFYFLRAEDEEFFAGFPSPYAVSNLLHDALFFAAATVRALDCLYPQERCVLLLQDWEAATTALALGRSSNLYRLFITLHNSYDSGALYAEDLATVGIDPMSCAGPEPGSGVLERAIPLVEEPVFTVSDQFALDLKQDILETKVMGRQLQHINEFNPVGINNGPFSELKFDRSYTVQGLAGIPYLQQWKLRERSRFLDSLEKSASDGKPIWGDLNQFHQEELSWFVMAGRDDPRQKGYDIAADATNRFLEGGGRAQFLFFPIPGDAGIERLEFLQETAKRYPCSVIVAPSLAKEDFVSALHGASYGLMPSLYEPFGMANEFYMNGLLAIGRATGGLIQQVVPLRAAASFSPAVRRMAERWHNASSHPTGILYRERDNIPSMVEDWKIMNDACCYIGNAKPPQEPQNRTFRSMCEELLLAIKDGVRIFTERPELYYGMLLEGVAHIERTFSWEKVAAEYVRYCVMER
jgi:glycogen synthase